MEHSIITIIVIHFFLIRIIENLTLIIINLSRNQSSFLHHFGTLNDIGSRSPHVGLTANNCSLNESMDNSGEGSGDMEHT